MTATPPTTRLGGALDERGRGSQRWLAEQIGINEATVSRYVHGLHVPDAKRRAIAEALGRDVGDLWPEREVAA